MLAHLRAILALPFNVLVVVPALLLWLADDAWRLAGPADLRLWLALACFVAGVTLMATTIRLFATRGEGTLAPWEPTQRLVVAGPYRYVRNPMISGVLSNLLGLALLFGSWWIFGWFALFAAGNAIYMPVSEEPGLRKRFGDDYARYAENVPRWIPRLSPWGRGPWNG